MLNPILLASATDVSDKKKSLVQFDYLSIQVNDKCAHGQCANTVLENAIKKSCFSSTGRHACVWKRMRRAEMLRQTDAYSGSDC